MTNLKQCPDCRHVFSTKFKPDLTQMIHPGGSCSLPGLSFDTKRILYTAAFVLAAVLAVLCIVWLVEDIRMKYEIAATMHNLRQGVGIWGGEFGMPKP